MTIITEELFIKILNMSITATWFILAVIILRFIFKKIPKGVICILWGLVALRLILPFSFFQNGSTAWISSTCFQVDFLKN